MRSSDPRSTFLTDRDTANSFAQRFRRRLQRRPGPCQPARRRQRSRCRRSRSVSARYCGDEPLPEKSGRPDADHADRPGSARHRCTGQPALQRRGDPTVFAWRRWQRLPGESRPVRQLALLQPRRRCGRNRLPHRSTTGEPFVQVAGAVGNSRRETVGQDNFIPAANGIKTLAQSHQNDAEQAALVASQAEQGVAGAPGLGSLPPPQCRPIEVPRFS